MNLLITGGAGFIGSNLVRSVIDRPEVARLVNLDCLTYAGHLANLAGMEEHEKYVFAQVDLRDRVAVRRVMVEREITHVMHLAAESHVDRSIAGPKDFVETNVMGTFNLLEACRGAWEEDWSGKKFLHVSTDEVYGSLGPEGRFTEASPHAPNSPYAASKAAADMLVRAHHHTYGLPAVITNGSNNYGPRQFPEKLIPVAILAAVARRAIPVYGDGLNVREWMHVEDHCAALWRVLEAGRMGEIYNIGSGDELPNLRLVEMICDLVDELRPELGGNTRSLMTLVRDRPGHDRRYAIDAGKIRRELGWKPAWNFTEGLRATVRWYLENDKWLAEVGE